MARKKEERDQSGKNRRIQNKIKSKRDHGTEKEDAEVIKCQLATVGLTLRPVPGDGNCLFRALGDQLDGHMGNHHRHRQDTVNYMREHREDFQPFVEDDVPFDKHISSLAETGTYAGNDAIVAFARLHQVTVVIHQPNAPVWTIRGWELEEKHDGPQLHIAYHGGDHYDSVRRIGDTSHVPANIRIEIDSKDEPKSKAVSKSYSELDYDLLENEEEGGKTNEDVNDIEREAMERSGCTDICVVRELLFNNCGNLDATIEDLITWNVSVASARQESKVQPMTVPSNQQSNLSKKSGGSRKQMERMRKQERKRASEERKKLNLSSNTNQTPPEDALIVGKIQCLNI